MVNCECGKEAIVLVKFGTMNSEGCYFEKYLCKKCHNSKKIKEIIKGIKDEAFSITASESVIYEVKNLIKSNMSFKMFNLRKLL